MAQCHLIQNTVSYRTQSHIGHNLIPTPHTGPHPSHMTLASGRPLLLHTPLFTYNATNNNVTHNNATHAATADKPNNNENTRNNKTNRNNYNTPQPNNNKTTPQPNNHNNTPRPPHQWPCVVLDLVVDHVTRMTAVLPLREDLLHAAAAAQQQQQHGVNGGQQHGGIGGGQQHGGIGGQQQRHHPAALFFR